MKCDVDVSLDGYYLTDDSTELMKFSLSGLVIPSHGHLIIWADDDMEQGSTHANFKLSANDGEEIILSLNPDVIDRIQFFHHNNNPEARIPDVSYGRSHDGGEEWCRQIEPTPNTSNKGGLPRN